MLMVEELIKSKERVQQHGEVFTPSWMVNLMLDIPGIKEATESIDATFLEPAAGDGNFLVALLGRKLAIVEKLYAHDLERCKLESLWALASIYGIEFLEDNHNRAQERMLASYSEWWLNVLGSPLVPHDDYYRSARFLIEKNIVRGDTLEQINPVTQSPIIFFEWKRTQYPTQVRYSQERLDSELKPSDNIGTFYDPDSGHLQSIADTLFTTDLAPEQEMLKGKIELAKIYKLEKP